MRRLPREGMLTNLLARGQVDARLVRQIARQLARFHDGAPTGPGVSGHGSPAAIRRNWAGSFVQAAPYRGRTLPDDVADGVEAYVARFLRENRDLLERRVATGRVRDGHGDAHAGNICVAGGRVHLFDCIEFCARFRCADVAADVAFLAMDLDRRGRADLASAYCAAYAEESLDGELWTLLPFYKCHRAFVRGLVTSLRLDEPGTTADQRAAVENDARAYFELAWSYAA